ncbi:hypothetical protein [Hypericibacter sp.]|uniref:hypothetical protein n=1 Tax=Hypericibacter sp. TaxID=2705401 RepID=UPI003D6D1B7B
MKPIFIFLSLAAAADDPATDVVSGLILQNEWGESIDPHDNAMTSDLPREPVLAAAFCAGFFRVIASIGRRRERYDRRSDGHGGLIGERRGLKV